MKTENQVEEFNKLYNELSEKMAPYSDLSVLFDLPQWVDSSQADISKLYVFSFLPLFTLPSFLSYGSLLFFPLRYLFLVPS